MSDIFAKLFTCGSGQVLYTLTETDDCEPAIEITTVVGGVSFAAKLSGWTGAGCFERAQSAFDSVDQQKADAFRADAVASIPSDGMLS